MKSLREILLEKHQNAEPKLDQIRQTVVEGLQELPTTRRAVKEGRPEHGWFAWLLSLRWHLAGLGSAWLVVAWLSSDGGPAAASAAPQMSDSSPRRVLLALKENRRQLLELLGPSVTEPPAVPPRRTELAHPLEMA